MRRLFTRTRRQQPPASSPDVFWQWASSALSGLFLVQYGVVVWVNRQFEQATGYPAAALLGRPPLTLVHPDDRDRVQRHARAMLQGTLATPYEYRFHTCAGETRWALETVASVQFHDGRAVLGNFMDITAQKQAEALLAHQAFHDPLTGLPNRALFLERLQSALVRRQRHAGQVAVLYLDLDEFKAVNDRWGHHGGDAVLLASADRLRDALRLTDTVARFGGDEFTVLLEDVATPADACRIAEHLLAVLKQPSIVAGHAVQVSASTGLALSTPQHTNPEELLREADSALYRAKGQGKGCVVFSEPLSMVTRRFSA